jgi:sugar transferase (PEP-CTERM system associated)
MLRVFKQYHPIRNIFFVVGEGTFIFISVYIVTRILLGHPPPADGGWLMLKILLITAVCQGCLYYNDLYDFKVSSNFNELGIRLMQALGFAAIFLAIVYILFPDVVIGRWIFSVSIAAIILLIVSWRFCYKLILDRGMFNEKIILLGSSGLVKQIKQEICERLDCGYTLVLELPESDTHGRFEEPKHPELLVGQRFEGLARVAKALGIKKIIAGFKEKRHTFPTKELLRCRMEGIDVIEGISFYENLTGKLTVESINPSWLIFSGGFQKSRTRRFLKRTLDVILSVLMLILCLPLIALTALLIKIDSKGPVIFSQERVGEKGAIYWIHKFRSMRPNAEKESGPVWARNDDKRVTRIGKFIRLWRIDEVPQLWNVLNGSMSFVGPRPERDFFVKELQERIPYYAERFTVKPGITGWAQICFSYGASVEDAIEKLNYDLFYIKNMTTLLDLMIVIRTIKIVLFSRGAR